jgi:outer membrane protein
MKQLLALAGLISALTLAPAYADTSAADVAPVPKSDAPYVDLWQLYQEAELGDPERLAARARSQGGEWRKREAFGQLLPQLNAGGTFNRTLQDTERNRALYNGERYYLSLSQVLYDPQVWHNYRRFSELARQQHAELAITEEEATLSLIERYFMTLAAEDELALVEAELRSTERNLERVNSLYARQLALVTDVLEVSARADALKSRQISARNTVEAGREALSELVGREVREPLKRIDTGAQFSLPEQDRETWVEQALSNSPVLEARRRALAVAQAGLRQAKGGHAPKMSLSLSGQRSDIGYENAFSPRTDTYVASLNVQLPLYAGGSTDAGVKYSYAELQAVEQDLEKARRQVIRETRSAFYASEAGVSKVAASRKALQSANKAREAAERAFGFGVINAVDVLNTIQEEYAARRALLQAQYDLVMSSLALRRWSGTLVRDDVRKASQWLSEPAR